jgi:hypothetical protein
MKLKLNFTHFPKNEPTVREEDVCEHLRHVCIFYSLQRRSSLGAIPVYYSHLRLYIRYGMQVSTNREANTAPRRIKLIPTAVRLQCTPIFVL